MSESSLMAIYNRIDIEVASGSGVWLTDTRGRAYLDCVQGIASNALGHSHPALVAAIREQADKLWHVGNIFQIPDQKELAKRLTRNCFASSVFFVNSGAEAVEGTLKVARKYHSANGKPERTDVIGFEGSFHGRTYGAINASGNPAYLDGFGPRLPGYIQLPLNDDQRLEAAIRMPTTAAVIVEPVQGEGGARALPGEWLQRLRALTRERGVLLIYDEVQSGMGRTGKLFAHQWFDDVEPDIMAVAKALGGGFPIGACLATAEAAQGMEVGSHGSTFGGNPLAMAVAVTAFDEIARRGTLENARIAARKFGAKLEKLREWYPDVVAEIRGKGLLIGLRLRIKNRDFISLARDEGLLIAAGGDNCVRLLPPLNIKPGEIDEIAIRLDRACRAARCQLRKAA